MSHDQNPASTRSERTGVDDQPIVDLSRAPLPTPQTLRRRRSLVLQLGRFAAFNYRILRMVAKGHADDH